ncbi:trypsin, alkaline C-like [Manduca sexta]|uniref:trypsin, alkaline C-like n=1 Tax=Manduca sexta TaxID=7130 RepID=UPI00188E2314|nr:trypsin, alkaline C-like [Manduca sexta]
MASSGLIVALALLAAVSAAPESRIVGGEHTTIEQFPYIVALTYFYPGPGILIQRCVGSLLSSWHVLTTSYCFTGGILNQFEVRAGSTNSLSGGVVVLFDELIKYPNYVEKPREGDVAVVRLKTPLGISSTIDVLYLPPQGTSIADGSSVKVVSWGFEYEGGPQLQTLKTINLYKVNVDECKAAYEGSEAVAISDRVICAKAPGRGICFGDAGAPMVIGRVVVGTASYYESCDTQDYPDLFSRIDTYTNWILSVAVAPRSDIRSPTPMP